MHMDIEDRARWCKCDTCTSRREVDAQRARESMALIRLVVFVGILVFALMVALAAHAYAAPSGKWRLHEDVLARIVVAEADGSESDWAAILWTLNHRLERYGDTPERTMLYSTTVRSNAERPKGIHQVDLQSAPRKNQLLKALGYVRTWINGGISDPCPDSLHWHGIGDSRPGWFELISCGPTRNSFGKVRRKQ